MLLAAPVQKSMMLCCSSRRRGGEQLQNFGHHLIAEPEADRQHTANPTLADAAAQ